MKKILIHASAIALILLAFSFSRVEATSDGQPTQKGESEYCSTSYQGTMEVSYHHKCVDHSWRDCKVGGTWRRRATCYVMCEAGLQSWSAVYDAMRAQWKNGADTNEAIHDSESPAIIKCE
jgi:hypothetical protein